MRRFRAVGLWVLFLGLVLFGVPGHSHVVGPTIAYAFDDPYGGSYDQDGSSGGGGAGGATYGDPDGPQAGSKSRTSGWHVVGGGWRTAGVYRQGGEIGPFRLTLSNLLLVLRYYYLRI